MANATQPHKPKRFRLAFVGATEDQPRLFRAYGKACGGEFALVMRPSEGQGLMVFITSEGAWTWRAGEQPVLAEGQRLAPAEVVQVGKGVRLRVLAGPQSGTAFAPYGELPPGVAVGDTVQITYVPDDQFAHVQPPAGGASDAPHRPVRPTTPKEAISAVKAEQKNLPKAGPITLRGQWAGVLHCTEAGQPQVELWRKLATYGTLRLISDPAGSWSWRFERGDKWFTDQAQVGGEGLPTLSAAIEDGVLGAMRLVREACSFRDTQRRAAHDPGYAEKHPIAPAREAKDPTERLKEPKPPREKKPRASRAKKAEAAEPTPAPKPRDRAAAPPPKGLDEEPAGLPDAPGTAKALTRMAREVEAEADVLAELRGVTWIWRDPGIRDQVARWFGERGMESAAELVAGYDGGPDSPLDSFIEELRKVVGAEGLDRDAELEALAQGEALRAGLLEAPQLVERARRLVLYATRMVQSPLCKGREQREATQAIKRATQAYEEARAAILEGRTADAQRSLRRVGERVALSAAKISRSCALGQQSLTAAVAEADAPAAPAPRQRKTRQPKAQPAPAPAPALAPPAAEVDPAKDKALLDAFSAAIAAAMQGAA